MRSTAQIQGQRGALYGLAIEREFARRCGGTVSTAMKTDVVDSEGSGHSIKNTRRSSSVRLLAKSYATIPDSWACLRAYAAARESGDDDAEKLACEGVVQGLRDRDMSREFWTQVVSGGEAALEFFTVYDNRTEAKPEDMSGQFRSFRVSDIVCRLAENAVWSISKRKHWSIRAHMPGFRPIAATISLGSSKRRLLLFTLCHVQRWLDWCEKEGLVCVCTSRRAQ